MRSGAADLLAPGGAESGIGYSGVVPILVESPAPCSEFRHNIRMGYHFQVDIGAKLVGSELMQS